MNPSDTLGSLRDRVLEAWSALPPEGPANQRPTFRALERRFGLPNGIFSRIKHGKTLEISGKSAEKMAEALKVPVAWLLTGAAAPSARPPPPAPPVTPSVTAGPEASRALAAAWATAQGIDERAVSTVATLPPYAYTPREWFALILVIAANLRIFGGSAPAPHP